MAQQVARLDEANPFSTDRGDELPVGVQLAWRLRALICSGRLPAGERLPSFRRLADWAGVNVNTVRSVYADLEEQGLVVSHQGQGTFVAKGVEAAPRLEEIAVSALRQARSEGLSPRELAIVVSACASMQGALSGGAAREAPAVDLPDLDEESEAIEIRHELRRQIGRLEADLSSYTRDLPEGLPTARLRAKAHIAGVEELEQTRDTLIAKLSEARRAAELRAREEDRARTRHMEPPNPGPLGRAMSWWRNKSWSELSCRSSRRSTRWGAWRSLPPAPSSPRSGRPIPMARSWSASSSSRSSSAGSRFWSRPLPSASGRRACRPPLRFRCSGRSTGSGASSRDPRCRADRPRRSRSRGRRHRDSRRPRRPQDPRGARRPSGARRRPDQEPGRAPLPGADADHRPARHLRPGLRDSRRHPRLAPLHPPAGRLLRDALLQRLDHRPLGVGGEVHPVRGDHRDRLLLQGDDRDGWRSRRRPRRQPGGRYRLPRRLLLQLCLHPDPARDKSRASNHPMNAWFDIPRTWLDSFGEIARFGSRVAGLVYSGRVLRFFGESLRQAGILILGSALVIWVFVFILGLQCGILGAYLFRAQGAPGSAGLFSAWCDLREALPYAFGYILAAKVGTGIVAELGAMRISDEIDALEVMGVPPVSFLCGTRLLAAWMAFPFMYLVGIGVMYFASYIAVVEQVGDVSKGGYLLIFWMFQNPPDLIYSLIKGMVMATAIVMVGCYYGYTASGGPVGVGTATAKSMVLNIVLVHIIGMLGTLVFWGANTSAPIGG